MEVHSFDLLNGKFPEAKTQHFDHLNKDNYILEHLLQGYILNCRCEGKSPSTISFYHGNLKRFLWYCRENNIPEDPRQLTSLHFRQFLLYVDSEPIRWGSQSSRSIRPTTKAIAHYYHCLHIFFEWLKREEIVHDNPLDRIKKPKKEKRTIQALSPKEIRALLDTCPTNTAIGFRNRTIIIMFIDSGMRVSELAGLKLPDVDFDSGSICVKNGKGRKQRNVRIGTATQKALWRYITFYRKGESDRLFLTINNQPLEADAIKLIIRRLGKKAGISGVHVHRFRHTFAISFLRAGGDIFSLKYLLGHNSLTMVENYLGSLNEEDAAKAHQKFSPIDNMRSF
jgi:site-specific recombinase XerD